MNPPKAATAYSYIRMSTDAQLHGDSLARQTERTQAFAERHGLVLDTSFKLTDIGFSAFDGSNIEKGALGRFLAAVKAGKIEKGSYLIVESLDRLSRQTLRQALTLLLDLLNNGIFVATVIDDRVFAPDSTDMTDLLLSLVTLSRANDESKTKSERVAAAWNRKRQGDGKILTVRAKAWLVPKPDRSGFDLIPERAAIVRRIFLEAVDQGLGAHVIANRLNREGVKPFCKGRGWHKSYILKVLHDPAVLGDFQAHKMVMGKRVSDGEVRRGYFPAVVSEDLFYRAQAKVVDRKQKGGGRAGRNVPNLFTKLARCGLCGSTMALVNKGRNDGTFLMCSGAREGLGCPGGRWRYRDFERSVLAFVREIDLPSVCGQAESAAEVQELTGRIDELEGRLIGLRAKRDKTFALYLEKEDSTFLGGEVHRFEREIGSVEAQLAERKAALSLAIEDVQAFGKGQEELLELVDRLQASGDDDDLYRIRAATQARLSDVASHLLVWPKGRPAGWTVAEPAVSRQVRSARLRPTEAGPLVGGKAFLVRFKDGTIRVVRPAATNPTEDRYPAKAGPGIDLRKGRVGPHPVLKIDPDSHMADEELRTQAEVLALGFPPILGRQHLARGSRQTASKRARAG